MYYKIFYILCLLIITITPYNVLSNCWDVKEVQYFDEAEMDGYMIMSFKDSVECKAVIDATVNLAGRTYKTDKNGYLKLSMSYFDSMLDKTLPIIVSKEGYCNLEKNINIMSGTLYDKRFLMSTILPAKKARFVLQWGKKPRDLDLHLVGKDFHISFRDMKKIEKQAKLDRDDVDSFGPETITFDRIGKYESYDVYVHNYSNETFINNEAEISVYKGNKLDKILKLPNTNKRAVHILQITNGMFYYKNNATNILSK